MCYLLSANKTELMSKNHSGAKVTDNSEGNPWRQGRQQCRRLGPLSWELLHWDPLLSAQQIGRGRHGVSHFYTQKMGSEYRGTEVKTPAPKANISQS